MSDPLRDFDYGSIIEEARDEWEEDTTTSEPLLFYVVRTCIGAALEESLSLRHSRRDIEGWIESLGKNSQDRF